MLAKAHARCPRGVIGALVGCLIGTFATQAEDVYVTSCVDVDGVAVLNTCPPSCLENLGTTVLSTAISTVAGAPPRSRTAIGASNLASWAVSPTLLQTNGTYRIYATKGTSVNGSPNLVVKLTAQGGSLATSGGVAASSINLTTFQSGAPNNAWTLLGYLTNATTTPTLNFAYVSGTAATTGGRWYMDAIRFENLDACTGVAPIVEVDGPIAAGQTNVTVFGVTSVGKAVAVFAERGTNRFEIGRSNNPTGFFNSRLTVTTSPLVKGDRLTATFAKTNSAGTTCTSQPAADAPIVGGGANSRLNVALGIFGNPAFVGPIGAETYTYTERYWLKATDTVGSAYGTAPVGGVELVPSECWQTVHFSWDADRCLDWLTSLPVTETNRYAAIERLAFAIGDDDSGPFDIYVDSIMNGDTLIENFEGHADGERYRLVEPGSAATPTPSATFLGHPNSCLISQLQAFDGTNSSRVQWQFKDTNPVRWASVLFAATPGKRHPQVDTTKPVTLKILMLPVGVANARKFNGNVGEITNSSPFQAYGTNLLSVPVSGSGNYSYHWTWSDGDLTNSPTERTYTIESPAGRSVGGRYFVTVDDGSCSETRYIVFPVPVITNQPAPAVVPQGSTQSVLTVGADGRFPSGFPLHYQWRTAGVARPNQTNATLWITNASAADVTNYDVVVTNSCGAVTSVVVSVKVVPVGNQPLLSHSQTDARHISFSWNNGLYYLAWAGSPSGPFTNILYGATSPHTVTIGDEGERYYRLVAP